MNKAQVEDLRRKAEAIFKEEFKDKHHADFSAITFDDSEAGIEVNLTINTLQGHCVSQLLDLAKEYNCTLSIHIDAGNLLIELGSNDNGGLTDETNAKYDAFEAYEKAGGKLTFEGWLDLPENEHFNN